MTAEEIRAISNPLGLKEDVPTFVILREVAAQLAEQNEQIREDRKLRQVVVDEERSARIKRDELLALSASGIDAVRANMAPPNPAPQVEFPGTVTHLACIIREPDGAYKIATNQGQLIELTESDFQRIFAPPTPSEAKPS